MSDTYEYRCSLVRVTDGDTLVVTIDLGFRLTATMPIRLLGLNAPEKNTTVGKQVKAWVAQWFLDNPDISVVTLKDPEKYGRWLGTITRLDGGLSLNDQLLELGYAKPYDGHGVRPTGPRPTTDSPQRGPGSSPSDSRLSEAD